MWVFILSNSPEVLIKNKLHYYEPTKFNDLELPIFYLKLHQAKCRMEIDDTLPSSVRWVNLRLNFFHVHS